MAAGLRLDDEGLSFPLLAALVVGQQLRVICGQAPGNREELILSWEAFPKVHEVGSEVVLAGKDGHA